MNIKQALQAKDNEIDTEREAFNAYREKVLAELLQAEKDFDAKREKLQNERNQLVMQEKLKAFPADLVKTHTHCACGAEMRPFAVMEAGQVVKYWACQVGSLKPEHDLVKV